MRLEKSDSSFADARAALAADPGRSVDDGTDCPKRTSRFCLLTSRRVTSDRPGPNRKPQIAHENVKEANKRSLHGTIAAGKE